MLAVAQDFAWHCAELGSPACHGLPAPMDQLASFSRYTMVGVTTEQNTTNLVPALQFGVERFLALDSDQASGGGWGSGMEKVLSGRKVSHARVSLEAGDGSITSIHEAIVKAITGHPGPFLWNLGGGHKLHQIALWNVFLNRKATGDLAVYADGASGVTRFIALAPDGGLEEQTLQTDAPISIEEVVTCFNRGIKKSAALPAPEKAEYQRFQSDSAWRLNWFRRFQTSPMGMTPELNLADWNRKLDLVQSKIIDSADRKVPAQSLTRARSVAKKALSLDVWSEALGLGPQPAPVKTAFGDLKKLATYFELLVIDRVAELVQGHPKIIQGLANAVIRDAQGNESAEHDVLLLTRSGTLRSLDAKTFDVEQKDLNSRLLQLSTTAGRFSRFVAVFPYFIGDFASGAVPAALQALPFTMKKFGQSFAVVAERTESFHMSRDEQGKVFKSDASTPGAVRCQTLEDLVASLR
jgi:hypothetical protein